MIIGFAGLKRSGKDTAAECLFVYGFKLLKFADPLKAMIRAFFRSVGIAEDMIERYVDGDLKEVCLDVLEGNSTRYFMQTLGTQFGRNLIGDNLWVNTFKRRAEVHDLVICTDVRFPNEVNAIHSMGGKVYRVVRPTLHNVDMHESESGIGSLKVDGEIINDGSVAELHMKIRRLVIG